MSHVAHIIDHNSGDVTVYVNGTPYNVTTDHRNYETIREKLNRKDYDRLEEFLNVPLAINKCSDGKVVFQNGAIFYNGEEIHNVLVDRILKFSEKGYPFEPLIAFLENVLKNPLQSAKDELYLFLETGNNPVTDDGCFLAYKKVNMDLKSIHASPDGTHLDHSIGAIVHMDRDEVDDDRDRTCSKGLHFCSLTYLPKYGCLHNSRVVIVKINPRDVVAIPRDYNNTKGRACCYEVIAEYDSSNREQEEAFEESYIDTNQDVHKQMVHVKAEKAKEAETVAETVAETDDQANDDAFVAPVGDSVKPTPARDVKGRFIKRTSTPPTTQSFGYKPSGKKYHNVRGKNGRFTKKS